MNTNGPERRPNRSTRMGGKSGAMKRAGISTSRLKSSPPVARHSPEALTRSAATLSRPTGEEGRQVTRLQAFPEGLLLYTKPQMAAALQVSVRCVTAMMRRGDIAYLKINGRLVRFRPEDALHRLKETSLICEGKPRMDTNGHQ